MGKGSTRRPTNEEAFQDNWEAIFGKKKAKQCKMCEQGTMQETSTDTLQCNRCEYMEEK